MKVVIKIFIFAVIFKLVFVPRVYALPEILEDNLAMQTVGLLYQERCLPCHGVYGRGDGSLASKLKPKPKNFNSYDEMRGLFGDQERIENSIIKGHSVAIMNAIDDPKAREDPLTSSQIEALAGYVQSFLAEEQFLLQLCVNNVFEFDSMIDDAFEIQTHGLVLESKKILSVRRKGGTSWLSISAGENALNLRVYTLFKKIRAVRTYFILKEGDEIPLLMTVRFNFPCPDYLEKQGGYELRKVF
jgi:hypothetical protein